jgi:hypothetical protein
LRSRGAGITAQIGGKIDRVDQTNGLIRIVDYKTGTENLSIKNLESLFTAAPSKRNDAAFQVFMYSWLFRKNVPDAHVIPCLYYVRGSYKQGFTGFINDQSDRTEVQDFARYEAAFEANTITVLETMANPSVPFMQTTDVEFCANCAYRQICMR